jgi:hypothetical protein
MLHLAEGDHCDTLNHALHSHPPILHPPPPAPRTIFENYQVCVCVSTSLQPPPNQPPPLWTRGYLWIHLDIKPIFSPGGGGVS